MNNIYVHYDKKTETATTFTSLTAITTEHPINYETLKYQFSRQKKDVYETDDFKLFKTKPVSSKRKTKIKS